MTTPRQQFANQFSADNPTYKVFAFPFAPSEVRSPVIAVWRTDLVHHPDTPNKLRHSMIIQAYNGSSLEEKAESALDDLIDNVMFSLQRIDGVYGITAERTVFGDAEAGTFQGWLVKCSCDSSNVYKSTILTEGSTP